MSSSMISAVVYMFSGGLCVFVFLKVGVSAGFILLLAQLLPIIYVNKRLTADANTVSHIFDSLEMVLVGRGSVVLPQKRECRPLLAEELIRRAQQLSSLIRLTLLLRSRDSAQQSGKSLSRASTGAQLSRINSEDELKHKFAGNVCAVLGCDACAIISYSSKSAKVDYLSMSGIDPHRLSKALAFNTGTFNPEQREDNVLRHICTCDCTGLGIGVSAAYRLARTSIDEHSKYYLWLGYRHGLSPSVSQLERAAQIAEDADIVLLSYFRARNLHARASNAENSAQERSQFLAHVSHDIRSPLNNIKSILSLIKLEQGIANAELSDLLDVALSNCESMTSLVEDILEFTRFHAGRLVTIPEEFDLMGCTRQIVDMYRVAARIKGLGLSICNEDSEYPCTIYADERHVKRIISNVISNAIKYTRSGEVVIEILNGSNVCTVKVRDTGIGMSPEQLRDLFTPFRRFDGACGGEGVGLGLALSRVLAEKNFGEIRVTSIMGSGSEFEICFPSAAVKYGMEGKPILNAINSLEKERLFKLKESAVKSTDTGLSVLLVDDDMDCVITLARSLRLEGVSVLQAQNIFEAMSILGAVSNLGAIISDGTMPHGGGKRLLKFAKSRPGKEVPVIILSGEDSQSVRKSYLSLGAAAVLMKPADLRELMKVLTGLSSQSVESGT